MWNIEVVEESMGELRVQALKRGGESLLDKVEGALGIAQRHLDRIRSGVLPASEAVVSEIDASVDRARALLA